MWFHEVVGKEKCPIVDTWWQTKPDQLCWRQFRALLQQASSCTHCITGIMADVVNEQGKKCEEEEAGTLVIKRPYPSMLRTIWGDPERFIKKAYFPEEYNGKYYVAETRHSRDKDGYFWILGRLDDVLNVSGHRLGAAELDRH